MANELIATTDYIPDREVFFVQIDLSDYLLEYYAHRYKYAPDTSPEHDDMLKTLISCFAIHLALRTSFETHAWTVQIVSGKPFSLFVTGDTGKPNKEGVFEGALIGNILTEGIRHTDTNGIHAQHSSKGLPTKSYVECESPEIVAIAQAFYTQSEQRPLRICISSTSDKAVGMMALSGCDLKWFEQVEIDAVMSVKDQPATRMKNCRFSLSCDCTPEKLLPFFKALTPKELSELYGTDEKLAITCPRCGRLFWVDRSTI